MRRGGFIESYKAEIAAYQLDRLLGMDMVPPVVERTIDGKVGAAVLWIEGTTGWNNDRPAQGPEPAWSRQVSRMKLFDQLIANIDRNQGNLLYDGDWHLFLIDHSRAFTARTSTSGIAAINTVDRTLWQRIDALTAEDSGARPRRVADGRRTEGPADAARPDAAGDREDGQAEGRRARIPGVAVFTPRIALVLAAAVVAIAPVDARPARRSGPRRRRRRRARQPRRPARGACGGWPHRRIGPLDRRRGHTRADGRRHRPRRRRARSPRPADGDRARSTRARRPRAAGARQSRGDEPGRSSCATPRPRSAPASPARTPTRCVRTAGGTTSGWSRPAPAPGRASSRPA